MCFTGPMECLKPLNQLSKIHRFHVQIHTLWQQEDPWTLRPPSQQQSAKTRWSHAFWWVTDSQCPPLSITALHTGHGSSNFSLGLCFCFPYKGEPFLQIMSLSTDRMAALPLYYVLFVGRVHFPNPVSPILIPTGWISTIFLWDTIQKPLLFPAMLGLRFFSGYNIYLAKSWSQSIQPLQNTV